MTLAQRCRRVELLILDVDGVLTEGGLELSSPGHEAKRFFVRDGSALKRWQTAGKKLGLLSGRPSPATLARAEELGITAVVQDRAEKTLGLARLLTQFGVTAEQTAMVGDDTPDVPVLTACGFAVAVADGCAEVRRVAHYITQAAGGRGAVREIIDLILRAQGK